MIILKLFIFQLIHLNLIVINELSRLLPLNILLSSYYRHFFNCSVNENVEIETIAISIVEMELGVSQHQREM